MNIVTHLSYSFDFIRINDENLENEIAKDMTDLAKSRTSIIENNGDMTQPFTQYLIYHLKICKMFPLKYSVKEAWKFAIYNPVRV